MFVIPLITGMMFAPINNFYGVRCFWTLKSDKVWNAVHKYAGYACAVSVAPSFTATGFFLTTILTPTLLMFKAVDRINEEVMRDSN